MSVLLGLALLIGLLLGLLGGGGSILTVPVLVYIAGLEPKTAVATSLVVVGSTSGVAMLQHAAAGRVCWKNGALFGMAAMAGGYGGGRLGAYVPGHGLLLLFAGFMLLTATAMLRKRPSAAERPANGAPLCPLHLPVLRIVLEGGLVGAFSGLVGAGGGFLIVPALNLLGGLPMHAAVATSLLVLTLQSGAAVLGYISHVQIDGSLAVWMGGFAIVGSLIGSRYSQRINAAALRRAFAYMVIAVAAYLLYREWPREWLGVFSLLPPNPAASAALVALMGVGLGVRLHRRRRERG